MDLKYLLVVQSFLSSMCVIKVKNVYAYVDVILAMVDPGGGPSNKM